MNRRSIFSVFVEPPGLKDVRKKSPPPFIICLRGRIGSRRKKSQGGEFTVTVLGSVKISSKPALVAPFVMLSFVNPFRSTLSDECCIDRALLLRLFRELEEATGVSLYLEDELGAGLQLERLPMLELDFTPAVVFAEETIAAACGSLRHDINQTQVEGNKFCGADAEWELGPSGRLKVATIQLAPLKGTAFLFHLQRGHSGVTKETFPHALKALLEDGSIVKVRSGRTSMSVGLEVVKFFTIDCGRKLLPLCG